MQFSAAGAGTDRGMDRMGPVSAPGKRPAYLKHGVGDELYVDYKAVDDLRRCMTPNGKIYSRKRLGTTAREQRLLSSAIKRARYMALLPYTDATL
jgi:small subunit ribosomal protein S18